MQTMEKPAMLFNFTLLLAALLAGDVHAESKKEIDEKILKDLDFYIMVGSLESADDASEVLDGDDNEKKN